MKSNKIKYIFLVIIVLIIIGAVVYFIYRNNKNDENKNDDSSNNVARLAVESNIPANDEQITEINNRIENSAPEATVSEEELATYSTKLGGSSEGRLTNIRISCEKLNGTVVSNGETFSFCETVGPSTAEEGYKEAPVIVNGEKVQGLGGGNCQISSTLYNAVLSVPNLTVVERHEHGREVHYVPEGKDAAVSYGSVDFKFKNEIGNDIKLYFSTDNITLSATIVKLI